MTHTFGFFGAGHMAQAISAALAKDAKKAFSSRHDNRNRELAKTCDTLFLAVRPADVAAVAEEVRDLLTDRQMLVSVVAGLSLKKLRTLFGKKVRIVRVMPNLGLSVGVGMCAIAAPKSACEADIAFAEEIFGKAGKTVRLAEKDFDAVTALSGSGPAFFAYMLTAMGEAGLIAGLKPQVAALLAAQTMVGTVRYLTESGEAPDKFISRICTAGGTTEAGMRELSSGHFELAVVRAVMAAAKRSAELGA